MHHSKGEEKINVMLDLLAKITSSKALLPYERRDTVQVKRTGVYVSNEHPKATYQRVIDGYKDNYIAENHQKEKIATGEIFEQKTKASPKEINNIDTQREIDIFKPRLHQIILDNYQELTTHGVLLEYLPLQAPGCHEINFERLGKFFPLHEMTIEKIFEFLETRRYFPDRCNKPKGFLSGLHDTTHAIYAAYCDIFVTNDKKLKNKAAAAYAWLDINTLILSPDELVEHLAN
jgi:hypothetical protein